MSNQWPSFDELDGGLKKLSPMWDSLFRACAPGVVGVGLLIACIGLMIYAGLPGAPDLPWMMIVAGVVVIGLVLMIVTTLLLLRWYRSYRENQPEPPSS